MKHDVETNQTRLWGKASVGSAIADWRKRNSFQRIYTKTQIRDHSITQTQANTLGTTSTQTSDSLDTSKTPLSARKKKKKSQPECLIASSELQTCARHGDGLHAALAPCTFLVVVFPLHLTFAKQTLVSRPRKAEIRNRSISRQVQPATHVAWFW